MAAAGTHLTPRCLLYVFLATPLALKSVTSAETFFTRHENPVCPEGCTQNGNCNGDTGHCECAFGYAGPSCEDRVMPACHTSLEVRSIPLYGTWSLKNCNCFRQLARIGCTPVGDKECLYESLWNVSLTCFEVAGQPPELQTSNVPREGFTHPSLEWYSGQPLLGRDAMSRKEPPMRHRMPEGQYQLPLDACPDRCNERGICGADGPNAARGTCICMTSYNGTACENIVQTDCYLSCSGGARSRQPNGTCIQGFCHCPPGLWGLGCSRNAYYTSSKGWAPSHVGLRIFVYNLPQNVVHKKTNDGVHMNDMIYLAEEAFTSELLAELVSERGAAGRSYVTQNPWEANLFLVPTWSYHYSGNVVGPLRLFRHVIHHLRTQYPFWKALGGRNHIMWATNDRGVCDWHRLEASLKHPIIMTHFGQSPRIPVFHPLRPTEALQVLQAHSETVHRAMAVPMFRGFLQYTDGSLYQEHTTCYKPEKDIVVPPIISGRAMELADQSYDRLEGGGFSFNHSRLRKLTLVFTGGNRMEDMAYSQGVRQSLLYMSALAKEFQSAWRRPDIVIKSTGRDRLNMTDAKFCLAPSGFGWGIRLAEAMVMGCVPVIVQDHVYQFLWDVLPYDEFSLRVSRRNFHRLPEILDAVSEEELRGLQDGLARWHSAFVYRQYREYGKAYEYIIKALRQRLIQLWSANY